MGDKYLNSQVVLVAGRLSGSSQLVCTNLSKSLRLAAVASVDGVSKRLPTGDSIGMLADGMELILSTLLRVDVIQFNSNLWPAAELRAAAFHLLSSCCFVVANQLSCSQWRTQKEVHLTLVSWTTN